MPIFQFMYMLFSNYMFDAFSSRESEKNDPLV